MKLRYATICSGVEAVSLAWEPLGVFQPVFFSEIEPFPNAVLAHHWPDVPNLGDLTKIDGAAWRGKVDVLWASFPCQDFSVAGRRAGVAGERGGLALTGLDLVDAIDPYFFCFENVKGILSDRRNAFGHFLGRLVGESTPLEFPGGKWPNSGHVHGPKRSAAWRVMDAQYGGVAQQRQRVFLVGCPRGGASPQQILFEYEGVRRDSPPSREEAPAVAALTACGVGTCGADDNQAQAGHLIPVFGEVGRCLTAASTARLDADSENFVAELLKAADRELLRWRGAVTPENLQLATAHLSARVRRLTPLECERLQGFPDNHTRIPYKGKLSGNCPDGPRYKAVGNSLAVPEVRWIGERIVGHINAALESKDRLLLAA